MQTGMVLTLFAVSILLWVRRITRALATLKNVPSVPLSALKPSALPGLTVVIPARNEEKNLPCCLKSIDSQLEGNTNCLIINDRSTDQTEEILKKWGYIQVDSLPLHKKSYINLQEPPARGWTGKNNALHAASPYLQSDWLLFTDADTIHASGGISAALQHAVNKQLALLTLTPRCLTASWIEHLVQPTAMALMGLWFPLERVNRPDSAEHFANGQFLMIRKDLYRQIGSHQGVANCFLEDFAIMKKSKQAGAKAACHLGQDIYGTRMYQTLKEIWRGWRRIYLHAAESSTAALLKHFLELCGASIFPIAGLCLLFSTPQSESPLYTLTVILAVIWGLLVAVTSIGTYQTLRAPRRYALLHPLAALFAAVILLDAVRISLLHLETKWRG